MCSAGFWTTNAYKPEIVILEESPAVAMQPRVGNSLVTSYSGQIGDLDRSFFGILVFLAPQE